MLSGQLNNNIMQLANMLVYAETSHLSLVIPAPLQRSLLGRGGHVGGGRAHDDAALVAPVPDGERGVVRLDSSAHVDESAPAHRELPGVPVLLMTDQDLELRALLSNQHAPCALPEAYALAVHRLHLVCVSLVSCLLVAMKAGLLVARTHTQLTAHPTPQHMRATISSHGRVARQVVVCAYVSYALAGSSPARSEAARRVSADSIADF